MYFNEASTPPMSQSLRALNVSGFDVTGFSSPLTSAPLTSLSLSNAWEAKTIPPNAYPPPAMLARPLLKFLAGIPNLQTLDISYAIYCPKISYDESDLSSDDEGDVFSGTIYDSCRDAVKVSLPNLRFLSIHDEPSMLHYFFESLILPPRLNLALTSEARAEDDKHEHTSLSVADIASYDARLASHLQSRYGATSSIGARYTRLALMSYGKAGTKEYTVTVELSHPGSSDTLQLTMDRGSSEGCTSDNETLLRLLPILPSLNDICVLDVRIDLCLDGWKAISQWLSMVTHLVVYNFALESLLRADEASDSVLFVHLEDITIDGIHVQDERDLLAYLQVRSDKGGRDVQWRTMNAASDWRRC
ncbi:hypothetical protein PENSPDRAFT_83013 [Peniophora sp. CONT]|nr:hypothetical protein PENSPDRAFT_83013 [Peniophora sp. CONT]